MISCIKNKSEIHIYLHTQTEINILFEAGCEKNKVNLIGSEILYIICPIQKLDYMPNYKSKIICNGYVLLCWVIHQNDILGLSMFCAWLYLMAPGHVTSGSIKMCRQKCFENDADI